MAFHQVHFTQPPRGVDFGGLLIDDVAYALASSLEDALARAHRLHHRLAVCDVVAHRLFAVDILAGGHSVQHNSAMLVVWYSHKHRIHIFPVQQQVVIPCRWNVRSPSLFPSLLMHVVQVRGSDEHPIRNKLGCPEQVASSNPCPNGDEANFWA